MRPAGAGGLDKAHEGLDARFLRARATAVPALTRDVGEQMVWGMPSAVPWYEQPSYTGNLGMSSGIVGLPFGMGAQPRAGCRQLCVPCLLLPIPQAVCEITPAPGAADGAFLTPRGAMTAPRPCPRCGSCHGGPPACGPGCCAAPAGAGALLLRPVREGIQGI